jgi:hypothetical protein
VPVGLALTCAVAVLLAVAGSVLLHESRKSIAGLPGPRRQPMMRVPGSELFTLIYPRSYSLELNIFLYCNITVVRVVDNIDSGEYILSID